MRIHFRQLIPIRVSSLGSKRWRWIAEDGWEREGVAVEGGGEDQGGQAEEEQAW